MIEFNIWKDCKNNCKFCFNRIRNNTDNKLSILKQVNFLLDEKEIEYYKNISLIGGEIFDSQLDNPEVKIEFYKIVEKIINKNKKVFIMTNLIYQDNKDFYDFINFIKKNNYYDNITISTSYDIWGRFCEKTKKIFDKNFKYLNKNKIKTTMTIILSAVFLEQYNTNKINIKKLRKQYTDFIYFISPNTGEGNDFNSFMTQNDRINFFPKRLDFIVFLNKMFFYDKDYKVEDFMNSDYHKGIHYELKNNKLVKREMNEDNLSCFKLRNYIDDETNNMKTDFINFRKSFYDYL
ncbi:MAG: radical SAM protein [Romboutsia timonensis]|uniref:radical SAM protein n=1 Tax=Romboutsia timonensis TaxID=1776391 RepID=UPI002A76536A|nr:radical SAM protein [Romboutsia timonensis]MDY2882587.1 radical SAM protein [Romboutsia timonensis]